MPPVTITGRSAKRLTGTVIIWSAAVGAYVVVEGNHTWKDPGDTKRDLAPAVSFQAVTSVDTGYLPQLTDTILERVIARPIPEKPGPEWRDT